MLRKILENRWTLGVVTAFGLLVLIAGPTIAQSIPAGSDVWNTPGSGGTYFTMPGADLDSLCGGNHADTVIVLKGQNLAGQGNGDIVIDRDADAVFDANGDATVNVSATDFSMANKDPVPSVCGDLNFAVSLNGPQPITQMDIHRDDSLGGIFVADIHLDVVFDATLAATGEGIGSLPYHAELPDPGGTPWGYNPPTNPLNPGDPWFPGVTKTGSRVTVNRAYDPRMGIPASHAYKPPKPLPPPQPPCEKDAEPVGDKTAGLTTSPAPCPSPTEL